MMPATLVLIADGSEEMEAVIIVDVLRRAGWPVVLAATGSSLKISASRGVTIVADSLLSEIDPNIFSLIVLPGGKQGTQAFATDPVVLALLRNFKETGKHIAAICAAPLALEAAGILAGSRFTCYPGTQQSIGHGTFCPDDPVVVDGTLTTSQGPGTAFDFALNLVARLENKKAAENLRRQMVLAPNESKS